jgi:hypothetical protein
VALLSVIRRSFRRESTIGGSASARRYDYDRMQTFPLSNSGAELDDLAVLHHHRVVGVMKRKTAVMTSQISVDLVITKHAHQIRSTERFAHLNFRIACIKMSDACSGGLAGAKRAGNSEHRGSGKLVHVKSPKRKQQTLTEKNSSAIAEMARFEATAQVLAMLATYTKSG